MTILDEYDIRERNPFDEYDIRERNPYILPHSLDYEVRRRKPNGTWTQLAWVRDIETAQAIIANDLTRRLAEESVRP